MIEIKKYNIAKISDTTIKNYENKYIYIYDSAYLTNGTSSVSIYPGLNSDKYFRKDYDFGIDYLFQIENVHTGDDGIQYFNVRKVKSNTYLGFICGTSSTSVTQWLTEPYDLRVYRNAIGTYNANLGLRANMSSCGRHGTWGVENEGTGTQDSYILYIEEIGIGDCISQYQTGVEKLRASLTDYEGMQFTEMCNYIVNNEVAPKGTLDISKDGEYNVKNYLTVNVATATEEVLKVTDNGTYSTSGYGSVDVEVPTSADAYFNGDFTSGIYSQNYEWVFYEYLKQCPPIDCSGETKIPFLFNGWPHSVIPKLLNATSVTTMNNLYYNCLRAKEIDVSEIYTNNVTNLSSVFSGCNCVKSLDLRHWNTSKVTSMSNLFTNCYALEEVLGLENFDTTKCTSYGYMFSGSGIKSVDVSSWNLKQNSYGALSDMFYNCTRLQELKLPDLSSLTVQYIDYFLNNCRELESVDMTKLPYKNFYKWNNFMSNMYSVKDLGLGDNPVIEFTKMQTYVYFNGFISLGTDKDMEITFVFPYFTTQTNMYVLYLDSNFASVDDRNISVKVELPNLTTGYPYCPNFYGCCRYSYDKETHTSITDTSPRTNLTIDLSGISLIASNINTTFGYINAKNLYIKGINMPTLYTGSSTSNYFCRTTCESITMEDCIMNLTNFFYYLFTSNSNLKSVKFKNCVFSGATTLQMMFSSCTSLEKFDFDEVFENTTIGNITNIASMFSECSKLTEVNIPKSFFDGKTLNMGYLFQRTGLKEYTLPDPEGLTITAMPGICFYSSIEKLSFGNNPITYNSTTMNSILSGATKLKYLDLSALYTTKDKYITNTSYMFQSCTKLEYVDLRNLDLSGATSTTYMFGSGSADCVPNDCFFIVRDETNKTKFQTWASRLTHVYTVDEYNDEYNDVTITYTLNLLDSEGGEITETKTLTQVVKSGATYTPNNQEAFEISGYGNADISDGTNIVWEYTDGETTTKYSSAEEQTMSSDLHYFDNPSYTATMYPIV